MICQCLGVPQHVPVGGMGQLVSMCVSVGVIKHVTTLTGMLDCSSELSELTVI